jgi:hypothetical protein
MMEILNQAIGHTFGAVFVVVLMSFMYKRDAIDWEQLASVYGQAWQPPRLRKRFANMILYSEGRPAKSYKGIIEIGLLEDGIAFRPNRILRPFQPPIFIPYTDIQGWDQGWYLDAKSAELSFRKAPQMRMIMPREQVEWMLSMTGGAVQISDDRPPHGTRPWATFIYALVLGALTLVLIVHLLVNGLPTTRQDLTRNTASLFQQGERTEKQSL